MKIKFLGGSQEVTGSTHVLMTEKSTVVRDAGLFQGSRKLAKEKNKKIYEEIEGKIDAIVLSHAHIDHCGNLPSFFKAGCSAPIYAQHATVDLCKHMLLDSAHIQSIDAQYMNKKLVKKGEEPNVEPLYSQEDVEITLSYFKGFEYDKTIKITDDIAVTSYNAGHILGACLNVFEITEKDKILKIGYAFDLGRYNLPIIEDPTQLKDIDVLVIESTYGNRYHRDINQACDLLTGIVNRVANRNGKIIIPSFALERTQEIIYTLLKMYESNSCEKLPIIIDSPLAISVTEVFMKHKAIFDNDTTKFMENNLGKYKEYIRITKSVEESKALNTDKTPMIIISASGMCESGRILHHLKNNVENPNNAVVIVGYQAENTLGRRIVEREKRLKIFGEYYQMNAERIVLNTYSGHADKLDLMTFIKNVGERCKTFVLVHGESKAITDLSNEVRLMFPDARIETPKRLDTLTF